MLNLFRNKLVSNFVWVVVFSLLVQALLWLWQPPVAAVYYTSPLLGGWLDALHQLPNGLYTSAGIVLAASLVMGFLFNYHINRHEVLFRQTVFPALFVFYFTHLFGQQTILNPHFLASFFVLFLISRFLSLETTKSFTTPFLDMGLFSALAFCLSPDTILFVPAVLLSLIFSGYLTFKTFMLYITGFFLPLYFAGLIFFLTDSWGAFTTLFSGTAFTVDFTRFSPDIFHIAALCLSALILLLSISGLRENYMKNTLRARKSQQMLLFFLLGGLCTVAFSRAPLGQSFTVVALPLSVYISYYFLKTKRAWVRETLFSLFFLILIIAVSVKYYT